MTDARIVIADDHASVREALAHYLNREPGLCVVGEACDGIEALERVAALSPDVLLLDLTMPKPTGLQVLQRLRGRPARPRVIVLSMHETQSYVEAALRAGADGYVTKGASAAVVAKTIREVHDGTPVSGALVPASPAPNAVCPKENDAVLSLSGRELEVLALIARGHTSKEIATRLQVARPTVDTYRMRIGDKLGARGRAELVEIAERAGILGKPSTS